MNEQFEERNDVTVEELKNILEKIIAEGKGNYEVKCISYQSFNFRLDDEEGRLYL